MRIGARPRLEPGLTLDIRGGRHPLLMEALGWGNPASGHDPVVPLDLALPEGARVLVISGPNAGGKSVALKGVGTFCMLAQCGWDVPAREDTTLPLAMKRVLGERRGPVVANYSTSLLVDDVARLFDCPVYRAPVGEANVAGAMLEHECIIGGEGNGGVIDLRVGPIRDSLVAIALVLQLMTETGKKISQLVREIGGYYMHKSKFAAEQNSQGVVLSFSGWSKALLRGQVYKTA